MTTTIEVFFAGLMLLSQPEGDEKVVVAFPRDDEHEVKLILLKGKAECNGVTIEADGTHGVVFPNGDDSLFELDYADGEPRLYWVTGAIGRVPTDKTKDYLAWLPSLSPMVLGDSRLRGDCRDVSASCSNARSRFFIERGRIATCHFAHDDSGPAQLQLYEFPQGVTRAIADVFSVKEEFEGDSIALTRGRETCTLSPESGMIRLFVAHASADDHESHFPRLHRLQRHFYQRLDHSAPKKAGLEDRMHEDPCEEAVEMAQDVLNGRRWVHSPTECGAATQP
jgi:hypothetical protein